VFSPIIHRYIFLFGICTLGGGMLLGTVSTSIPQFILLGNWLLEGKFKEKWSDIKPNQIFWVLSAVFFMHVLGMIHSTDIEFGLKDLRIKIPLLLLPLIFFTTKPLQKKELELLLWLFIAGITLSLFWCVYYSFTHVLPDIRKASRFISHIRLSLFICLGISVLTFFMITKHDLKIRLAAFALIFFFLWFMIKFGLVTGLLMLGFLVFLFLLYLVVKQELKVKIIGLSVVLIGLIIVLFYIGKEWKAATYIDPGPDNTIKQKSLSGRPYFEVKENWQVENGYYVAYNIQYEELYKQWPALSEMEIHGNDKKGNPLIWTLLRYMSSKGLTKDSAGLKQLSKEDVRNVESGLTNYKYEEISALSKRLRDFITEYQSYRHGANPSGNTMLMRFEFWKAAVYIIQRNPLFGVGTGDAPRAFEKAYYRTDTKLSREWRLRSHNQFLAITVSFGFAGLMVFLFSIFYPLKVLREKLHPIYFVFIAIALVSFVTEDTLESQAGVSFYAYFNTLFLWLAYRSEETRDQNL
jgi:hypothetical protein